MEKYVALYCRVSTALQSTGLEAQIRALQEWCSGKGITNYRIFQDENQSGTKSSRPSLDEMLKAVRNGEVSDVIVYSFSRFARSTTHLLSALEEFKKLGVRFTSTTEAIETDSPLGKAFFTILACLAQLERDLVVERVKNGLANARAKGKHIGRKKTRPSDLIRALLKSGMSFRNCARVAKCSHGSISLERKIMKQEEAELKKKIAVEEAKKNPDQPMVLDDTAPW